MKKIGITTTDLQTVKSDTTESENLGYLVNFIERKNQSSKVLLLGFLIADRGYELNF